MPTGGEYQVFATELERVESKIPTLFERDDVFYSQLEKRPVEIVSSINMRVPLEIRPGGKPGLYSSDGGDLGRGDMPLYDKASINTVELKYAMEWTTRRKWGTDSARKAIVDTFKRDLANSMREFRRFVESLCMTAGNGVLATVTSVTTTGGVDTYTLTTDGYGAKLLRYDQDIQLWNSTLTTQRSPAVTPPSTMNSMEGTIIYLDLVGKTIQVASFTSASVGDLVVVGGVTGTPPTAIFGVPYHHNNSSTGSWLGFNRATTPEVRANGVSVGGSLTLPFPRLAINKIGDRVGIDKRTQLTAWMHPCQKQAYEELGFEVIRIDKEAKEEGLDLYFNDNMRMAGAPVKCSYAWDKTRIDFVNYDIWGRAEFESTQWYKDDNGNRYFVVRGGTGGVATSNLAYIVASFNIYVNNPQACSYLNTLTVPTGY